MAFVPTPDGALLTIVWGNSSEEWTNNLWFRKLDFTENDMRNLVEEPAAAMTAGFKNHIHEDWMLLRSRVYDMRVADGPVVQSVHNPVVGTGTGDRLPITLCHCLTLRTARRGRSGRGRLYLAGFHEGDLVEGRWLPAVGSDALGWLGAINANAMSNGWTWCVRSGQFWGAPLMEGFLGAVTYTEFRSTIPTSQRSRSNRL